MMQYIKGSKEKEIRLINYYEGLKNLTLCICKYVVVLVIVK